MGRISNTFSDKSKHDRVANYYDSIVKNSNFKLKISFLPKAMQATNRE